MLGLGLVTSHCGITAKCSVDTSQSTPPQHTLAHFMRPSQWFPKYGSRPKQGLQRTKKWVAPRRYKPGLYIFAHSVRLRQWFPTYGPWRVKKWVAPRRSKPGVYIFKVTTALSVYCVGTKGGQSYYFW